MDVDFTYISSSPPEPVSTRCTRLQYSQCVHCVAEALRCHDISIPSVIPSSSSWIFTDKCTYIGILSFTFVSKNFFNILTWKQRAILNLCSYKIYFKKLYKYFFRTFTCVKKCNLQYTKWFATVYNFPKVNLLFKSSTNVLIEEHLGE